MARICCSTDDFTKAILNALGNPENVTAIDIHIGVDEATTVKVTQFLCHQDAFVEAINHFEMVKKEPANG